VADIFCNHTVRVSEPILRYKYTYFCVAYF
jgi:hypothetical protein